MNCDETTRLLHAYIDQELFLKDSLEIEKHIKHCQSCEQAYNNIRSLRASLIQCKKFTPDISLQDRIQQSINSESASNPIVNIRDWLKFGVPSFSVGLLASMVLFVDLSFQKDNYYTDEILSSHIRSLMASHLTDVSSSDKHQLKPWLSKTLDFSPPIEDLSSSGYTLIGARLDYIHSRQVVALVYQVRNHYINVFIWPASDTPVEKSEKVNVRGYDIFSWSSNRLVFSVVSDLNRQDLSMFVKKFKNKAQ